MISRFLDMVIKVHYCFVCEFKARLFNSAFGGDLLILKDRNNVAISDLGDMIKCPALYVYDAHHAARGKQFVFLYRAGECCSNGM